VRSDPSPGVEPPRRLSAPGWLLVGSSTEKADGVEVATAVLRRASAARPVTGLEVEILIGDDGDELEGDGFSLVDEVGPRAGADAVAMLRAGARRVLGLRSRPGALGAGCSAAFARLGPGALVVAVSNSLRLHLDPDLFLMAGRRRDPSPLPSAVQVAGLVDRWVDRGAGPADRAPAALAVDRGRWVLRDDVTAIVLAGGRSRRMGADKRFLPLSGGTLLERVVATLRPLVGEVVLSTNDLALGHDFGLRTVPDRVPGEGPLMALASALASGTSDRNLLVACDLPEIPAPLVRGLLEAALTADAVVPVNVDGVPEPLLAVYRRRLLQDAEVLLAAGERRLRALFERCRTSYLELAHFGLERLPNLNTREDYEHFLQAGGWTRESP